MPSTLERRNSADASNAGDAVTHDGRRSVERTTHPEGHAAFMARHPHLRRLATARELGDRDATEVAAEMLGAWLPDAKAARLAATLNATRSPRRIAAGITEAGLPFVSAAALKRFGVTRPASALLLLRLAPRVLARSGVPGVWRVRRTKTPQVELGVLASLHARPTSRVSMGVCALPLLAQWVKRPTPTGVNVPPDEAVSRVAASTAQHVTGWNPVTPFWLADSVPVFAPATELAYVAARPDDRFYPLSDAPDVLEDLCDRAPVEDVCAELATRPLAALVRAVCLAAGGDKLSLARALLDEAAKRSDNALLTQIEAKRNVALLGAARTWRPYPLKEFLVDTLEPASHPGVDMRDAVARLSATLTDGAVWLGADELRYRAEQEAAGIQQYKPEDVAAQELMLKGHEHLATSMSDGKASLGGLSSAT